MHLLCSTSLFISLEKRVIEKWFSGLYLRELLVAASEDFFFVKLQFFHIFIYCFILIQSNSSVFSDPKAVETGIGI